MKEIKNEKELTEAMHEDAPMPPSVMSTGGYGNLGFDCGCGEIHGVNGHDVQQIASFRPVKILFKCHFQILTKTKQHYLQKQWI